MLNDIQKYRARIKEVGLKATPQRISVLRVLSETAEHPSAEMLMEILENEGSIMSVGTIYNILETFEEKGLLIKLHDNNEVMRFDANTGFHVHIYDQKTTEIKDYYDKELESIIRNYLEEKLPKDIVFDKLDLSLYTTNVTA